MKISIGFDGWLLLFEMLLSKNTAAGFICVVSAFVHELGHLCSAKILKIKIRELKLGFAGAKIYPADGIISYKKEFFLCVWGPVFNILLSVICLIVLYFMCKENPPTLDEATAGVFSLLDGSEWGSVPALFLTIVVSLIQAAVNLLPVEGLDGGRMLVCLLSQAGDASLAYRAERIVTFASSICLWLFSTYMLLVTGSGLGIFVSAICIFAKFSRQGSENSTDEAYVSK